MTTWSSPMREPPRRYSNKPRLANRRTSRSTSLSMLRLLDAKGASGRPMRRFCARCAAPALNRPKPTEQPSKQTAISPSACVSSVTLLRSRAETFAGAAPRTLFGPGVRKRGPSGVGMNRVELVFLERPVAQSELYRHIVKPATPEAAIEMPQSGNDDSDDRHLNVRTSLIEDEEVQAGLLGEAHASAHLLARVEIAKLRAEVRRDQRLSAWCQIGIMVEAQWSDAVEARFLPGPAAHETQGQKLVELRQRTQQGDFCIEVRAGSEFDIFPPVLHPVRYRHKGRNPEIAGDIEHPKLATAFGQLPLHIADVGIIKLAEV